MLDLKELRALSEADLTERARENPEWYRGILAQVALATEQDRRECQLAYYQVRNPAAIRVHTSWAREVAVVGGNRSSKTDSSLAELAIRCTGHIPLSLLDVYPLERIKGARRSRIVCNSLTDTLEPVIKPKLRWDVWNGVGDPGKGRGHWGWIPRHCLTGGTWEKAYSERYRTLHVSFCTLCTILACTGPACRGCVAGMDLADGFHKWPSTYAGTSSIQLMSYDQDLSAFAGSSLDDVIHDELPPSDVYRENRLRTLDAKGQIITAFTPPDEIGASRADASWFHDEVYEPGLPGPTKHPQIDTITLFTEHNTILEPKDVAAIAERLTEEQRETRLHGRFMHLLGVVYKNFTDATAWWCFGCQKRIAFPVDGQCYTCHGSDLVEYSHVCDPFPIPANWPIVFVTDPHPRKPDALGWFAIAPSDDILLIDNIEQDGTTGDVAREVRRIEERLPSRPVKRLMDPNIATETNDKMQRGWTMRKAYDDEGLRCDLANDEMNVGIDNVEDLLRPDRATRRPRLQIFRSCAHAIQAMKKWAWDEWTRAGDKEPKEKTRDKWKDHADLVRYIANDRPSYAGYTRGMMFRHRGQW